MLEAQVSYIQSTKCPCCAKKTRLALVELEAALPGRNGAQLGWQVVGLLGRAHVQAGHVGVLQPAPTRSIGLSAQHNVMLRV